MKQYLTFTLSEISRTKKLSDEVKRGINALSQWKNLENYKNIIETYENSVDKIKEIVSQFSIKSAFDKVSNTYNSNYDIIDNYQVVMQNKSLNLQSFIDFFFENSYIFLSNNDIVWYCNQMGIMDEISEDYTIKPPDEDNNNENNINNG